MLLSDNSGTKKGLLQNVYFATDPVKFALQVSEICPRHMKSGLWPGEIAPDGTNKMVVGVLQRFLQHTPFEKNNYPSTTTLPSASMVMVMPSLT